MLESVEQHATDKGTFDHIIIVENQHLPELITLITSQISDRTLLESLRVISTEEVFKFCGLFEDPNIVLHKFGKFSFQTIKKFGAMYFCDYDEYLVLDSESLLIRQVSVTSLFENYFLQPYLAFSNLKNRQKVSIFTHAVVENVNAILSNLSKPTSTFERLWFLENFDWFYKKTILEDLKIRHGDIADIIRRVAYNTELLTRDVFEIQLYAQYIYNNNNKYGYNLMDIDRLLDENLDSKLLQNYRTYHTEKFDGNCGLLERVLSLVTTQNYKNLKEILEKLPFQVLRADQSLTGKRRDVQVQKLLFNEIDFKILAASQDHIFHAHRGYINRLKKLRLDDKSENQLRVFKYQTRQVVLYPFRIPFFGS